MPRPEPIDFGPADLPTSRPFDRTGRNAVERKAIARVQREIAAMPASLVVQLALWPDEIAAWARAEQTSESLVYNMLARRKPYLRMRERLAERLEVAPAVVAHLIDARRPLPWSKRDPVAAQGQDGDSDGPTPSPIDWRSPPYPLHRDGTNPIERRAVRAVERDIASMPAAAVVGLALWPVTLAEWSREQRLKSSVVWATLAGSPGDRVRAELARRLDVTRRDLDELVSAQRATPASRRPPPLGQHADRPDPRADGADGADGADARGEEKVGRPEHAADEARGAADARPSGPRSSAPLADVVDSAPSITRGSSDAANTDQLTLGF